MQLACVQLVCRLFAGQTRVSANAFKVARTLSTDALINRHRMTAVCAKSSARVIQETNSLYRNTEFQLLKKNLKKTEQW